MKQRPQVELANACSDNDSRDSGSRARWNLMMIRSSHSHFSFSRVSDGRYRRTNYRVIVRNLSSRTSWQVLFTLCIFIVSEYTYCHNSSVQNIVTNIVTILLCRISLHTFPTARCCLGVPWPVVHVCPLGS